MFTYTRLCNFKHSMISELSDFFFFLHLHLFIDQSEKAQFVLRWRASRVQIINIMCVALMFVTRMRLKNHALDYDNLHYIITTDRMRTCTASAFVTRMRHAIAQSRSRSRVTFALEPDSPSYSTPFTKWNFIHRRRFICIATLFVQDPPHS